MLYGVYIPCPFLIAASILSFQQSAKRSSICVAYWMLALQLKQLVAD